MPGVGTSSRELELKFRPRALPVAADCVSLQVGRLRGGQLASAR